MTHQFCGRGTTSLSVGYCSWSCAYLSISTWKYDNNERR